MVVNGVVGFAGLPVTLAALETGRRLALANKESLIAGAPVVQRARLTPGAELVPVDSEHCAIHQCLATVGHPIEGPGAAQADPARAVVRRLLITASGGPFRGRGRGGPGRRERAGRAVAIRPGTWVRRSPSTRRRS